jgi:hypothetical protein
MSWWEAIAFGAFESWLIQAVKNPVSLKALQLKTRLIAVRDLLNDAFRAWGWE